jgi:quercetin dioxygenase-like cupin family protein
MPRSGERYAMPDGLGEYLVVRSHEETGGEYVEMEWTLPATSFAPPPHRHPTQTESYEILAGSLDVMIDGEWQHLATGESATVPVGANHTFRLAARRCGSATSTAPAAASTSSSPASTAS